MKRFALWCYLYCNVYCRYTTSESLDDIRKDDFGIWNYSGSHPQPYMVYHNADGSLSVDKCGKGSAGSNVVFLRRLHSTHPSNSEFKRLICFVSDAVNNPHNLCLVSYRLDAGLVPVLSSHGNSKQQKAFYPTWPSTIARLKEECSKKEPKGAVEAVSVEVGG
jgi:hypothetical protein